MNYPPDTRRDVHIPSQASPRRIIEVTLEALRAELAHAQTRNQTHPANRAEVTILTSRVKAFEAALAEPSPAGPTRGGVPFEETALYARTTAATA